MSVLFSRHSLHTARVEIQQALPYFISKIKAGFPSPADDFQEEPLDLNQYLISHPAATFFIRVSGDSMIGAGIFPQDLLIVDRSLTPRSGQVVIAVVDGELTVKRMEKCGGQIHLLSENPEYAPIEIHDFQQFEIWGVVTHVIHAV